MTKIHPALCSKLMAGYIGPVFKASSSKAIPKYYPSIANESVPLFMFNIQPKTP